MNGKQTRGAQSHMKPLRCARGSSVHSAFTAHHSLFTTRATFPAPRRLAAQALVEYAIVFPLQLMLTLGIIQLAHLFVAKQVLEYAAYCAARAKVVGLDDSEARRAAAIPLSRVTGPSGVTAPDSVVLPGWGTLPRSGAALEKTDFAFDTYDEAGVEVVRCRIEHDYELQVPVGNTIAEGLAEIFLLEEGDVTRIGGAPHIRLRASCALPRP